MAVFKRGTSWIAQVYVGVDPTTGRKQYLSRSKPTKREATAVEAELRADVAQGRRKAMPKSSFGDLLDRWLKTGDWTASTRYNYERLVETRLRPALGHLPLRQVTTEALDTYYGTLRDKGLAPRTVLRVHAVVRRALGQGVRWGWLPTNPALLASPGRLGCTEVQAPGLTAIEAVLAEAKRTDPDLHAVVWLTAATGARRGEVCGLRWSDIDFDRQMLTIRRSVSDAGGKKVIGNTKTHQSRSLALDAISVELLRTMRLRAAERLLACGEPLQDNAYVYAIDVAGLEPMAPSVLSHRFSRLCKRAGVRMGLHGLRHAAATLLIASGTDVRTVSKRLGHADPSMTLRVYAHALQAQDRQAAEALGEMLGGATR